MAAAAVRLLCESPALRQQWAVLRPEWAAWSAAAVPSWDSAAYFAALRTRRLGRALLHSEALPSTQDVVLAAGTAGGVESVVADGLACVADVQTVGRGRGGNRWESPRGCLMFSYRCRVANPARLALVQYVVSLAAVDAARAVDPRAVVRLKWPNDLYAPGGALKLGGVLCQSSNSGGVFDVTVGVGINVSNREPTACLDGIVRDAVAPGDAPPPPIAREALLAEFFNVYEAHHARLEADGFAPFRPPYLRSWLHSGQRVEVAGSGHAVVRGIADSGYLVAELPEEGGRVVELHPDGNSFDFMRGLVVAKERRPQKK